MVRDASPTTGNVAIYKRDLRLVEHRQNTGTSL